MQKNSFFFFAKENPFEQIKFPLKVSLSVLSRLKYRFVREYFFYNDELKFEHFICVKFFFILVALKNYILRKKEKKIEILTIHFIIYRVGTKKRIRNFNIHVLY